MKNKLSALLVFIILIAVSITGCSDCKHEWKRVSCTEPKICSLCGRQSLTSAGHIYSEYGFCKECKAVLDFDTAFSTFELARKGVSAALGDTVSEDTYCAIAAFDELCGTDSASHFKKCGYNYMYVGELDETDLKTWISFMTECES